DLRECTRDVGEVGQGPDDIAKPVIGPPQQTRQPAGGITLRPRRLVTRVFRRRSQTGAVEHPERAAAMLNADGPITDEPIEPVAVEVHVMFVPADDANPVAGWVGAATHSGIVG